MNDHHRSEADRLRHLNAVRIGHMHEGHRKMREGHEHLSCDVEHALWGLFWQQAAAERTPDPVGPVRDELIKHYGMHTFLEERYERETRVSTLDTGSARG